MSGFTWTKTSPELLLLGHLPHLRHGPVEPPHADLVVGVAEGLELDLAYLLVPGELVEVHATGHVEVDPGAVPDGAVIIKSERVRSKEIGRLSQIDGLVYEGVRHPDLLGLVCQNV